MYCENTEKGLAMLKNGNNSQKTEEGSNLVAITRLEKFQRNFQVFLPI
jgi:hypothetical protein